MTLDNDAATLRRENSDRIAKCGTDDLLTAHRTLAKSHGVVTTGNRAQATLTNALSGRLRAMLLQAGIIRKSGDGMRLPNGFANDPDAWLRNNAPDWRLVGWPAGLPSARVSGWPSAQTYAVLALLLEGRIVLVSTAASSSASPSRIVAPQDIDPPRVRPRKSVTGDGTRSLTGTAAPESDVEDKGDELEVMGLLDAGDAHERGPSPSVLSATAPPDSDVESTRSFTKPRTGSAAKGKTPLRSQVKSKQSVTPKSPRIALMDADGDESEAQMTSGSSSEQTSSSDENLDDQRSDDEAEYSPEPFAARSGSKPPASSPTKSVKSIKVEPGTTGAKGKKRRSDAQPDGEPSPKKQKRPRSSIDASYKAALEKEKAAIKARKKAEREKLREERAAEKERERREKREMRALKEAARDAESLARDDRERRGVLEEDHGKGHKRRQSTRSDLGLDDRNVKRTKG